MSTETQRIGIEKRIGEIKKNRTEENNKIGGNKEKEEGQTRKIK